MQASPNSAFVPLWTHPPPLPSETPVLSTGPEVGFTPLCPGSLFSVSLGCLLGCRQVTLHVASTDTGSGEDTHSVTKPAVSLYMDAWMVTFDSVQRALGVMGVSQPKNNH